MRKTREITYIAPTESLWAIDENDKPVRIIAWKIIPTTGDVGRDEVVAALTPGGLIKMGGPGDVVMTDEQVVALEEFEASQRYAEIRRDV